MKQIPGRLLEELFKHAADVYPNEACGLFLQQSNRGRVIYVRCTNIAEDPKEAFRIDEKEMVLAEAYGTIIGICHSHPDCLSARPSHKDVVMCNINEIPWHIVSYPNKDYQCLMPEDMPLIGRPFVLGATDCWGLMLEWHHQYGIVLDDPRPEPDYPWWQSGKEQRYTADSLAASGFEMQNETTAGSVIVMQVQAPVANHAGLILPDGMMLHHLYGQLSGRTIYGDYWRERTWYICRHKDLPPAEEIENVT